VLTKSSAVPAKLFQYASFEATNYREMTSRAYQLAWVLARFESACREYPVHVSHLPELMRELALQGRDLGEWVHEVGIKFRDADARGTPRDLQKYHDIANLIKDLNNNRTIVRQGFIEVGRLLNAILGPGYRKMMEEFYSNLAGLVPYRGAVDDFLRSKAVKGKLTVIGLGLSIWQDVAEGEYEGDIAKIVGVNILDTALTAGIAATQVGAVVLLVNSVIQVTGNLQVAVQRAVAPLLSQDRQIQDHLREDADRAEDALEKADLGKVTKELSETVYDVYIGSQLEKAALIRDALEEARRDPSYENLLRLTRTTGGIALEQMRILYTVIIFGPMSLLVTTPEGRQGLSDVGRAAVNVFTGLVTFVDASQDILVDDLLALGDAEIQASSLDPRTKALLHGLFKELILSDNKIEVGFRYLRIGADVLGDSLRSGIEQAARELENNLCKRVPAAWQWVARSAWDNLTEGVNEAAERVRRAYERVLQDPLYRKLQQVSETIRGTEGVPLTERILGVTLVAVFSGAKWSEDPPMPAYQISGEDARRYRQELEQQFPDGRFPFGGREIPIREMTDVQLAAARQLLKMQDSSDPLTEEQRKILETAFKLDLSFEPLSPRHKELPHRDDLKRKFDGMTQGEVARLLAQLGLNWDEEELRNPGDHFKHPKYSVNQQLLELGLQYPPGTDSEKFARGREFILAIKAGTIVSCYPEAKPDKPHSVFDRIGAMIGPLAFLGTSTSGEIAPSHTALGAGNGMLVETGVYDGGINAGPTRAVDKYVDTVIHKGGIFVQDIPGITPVQRTQVADNAVDSIGEPYNLVGLIDGWPIEGTKYCSELAYDALTYKTNLEVITRSPRSIQHEIDWQYEADKRRISPMELKHATVNGLDLENVFRWFPEDYPWPKDYLPTLEPDGGHIYVPGMGTEKPSDELPEST